MKLHTCKQRVGAVFAVCVFLGVWGEGLGGTIRPPHSITSDGQFMVCGKGVSTICPDIGLQGGIEIAWVRFEPIEHIR